MKASSVDGRKAEDFREDGRAPFDGSRRQAAHGSPSDPGRVYPIDRLGYARGVYPAAVGQARDRGRYALESGPEGIDHFVGGKPCRTGRENQWSSSRFSSRRS